MPWVSRRSRWTAFPSWRIDPDTWTIAQGAAPRYAGTIATDAAGQGGLHINVGRSDQPMETFAVTLEPGGTTAAPTGPMVLVSKPT